MIYLGSPYSSPDPAIQQQRFERVTQAAAWLMQHGQSVFSPITHSHNIEQHFSYRRDWEFWAKQDLPLMQACDELFILTLEGWERSIGVQAEIEHARELGIPVTFMEPCHSCHGYQFRREG